MKIQIQKVLAAQNEREAKSSNTGTNWLQNNWQQATRQTRQLDTTRQTWQGPNKEQGTQVELNTKRVHKVTFHREICISVSFLMQDCTFSAVYKTYECPQVVKPLLPKLF